jgi:hypothetical protein
VGVKHKFSSLKADDPVATADGQVLPSHWNDDHQLVATSTANGVVRFDGTTGDAVKNSGVTIDDSNNMTVPGTFTATGLITPTGGIQFTATSTANAVARFSGTAGTTLQNSGVTIDNSDNLTAPGRVTSDTIPIWRGEGAVTGNLAIGPNALTNASLSGSNNTVISRNTGSTITTGLQNFALGAFAGNALTTGQANVALGFQSLLSCTTGNDNLAIGSNALLAITQGSANVAVGVSALQNCSGTGNRDNTAIGFQAAFSTTTGQRNVAIGVSALSANTGGGSNIAIGWQAGRNSTGGTNNVTSAFAGIFIGRETKPNGTGTEREIIIGHQAEGKGTDTTVIGATSATQFWAYGDHYLNTFNIVTDTTTGTKIGTGTTQKLGFWNATPIVQPTTSITEAAYVENAGGVNVNDDSTFDGYTLRQVVKALRDAGILA